MDKPKLPSIEYMLQGAAVARDAPDSYQDRGAQQRSHQHRRHASLSDMLPAPPTLPRHPRLEMAVATHRMQKLTIAQPAAPIEPRLHESSLLIPSMHQHPHQQRPSSTRTTHMRSFSDFSHPYPDALASASKHDATQTASTSSSSYHRRAISTNSLDFILQRPRHQRSSSCASEDRADDESPRTGGCSSNSDHSDHGEDAMPASSMTTTLMMTASPPPTVTTSGSTKYHCPYCDKGFSRPSSLRIHTYSHTGEKPFMCPEPGCSRKFSVQSNMRRHLRVHAKRAAWPDQHHHHRFSLASSSPQHQQHG